jgi:hypothetical protein
MAVGQRFADVVGVDYVPMRIAQQCECHYNDIACYLTKSPKFGNYLPDSEIRRQFLRRDFR